jgi:hypothetical protein
MEFRFVQLECLREILLLPSSIIILRRIISIMRWWLLLLLLLIVLLLVRLLLLLLRILRRTFLIIALGLALRLCHLHALSLSRKIVVIQGEDVIFVFCARSATDARLHQFLLVPASQEAWRTKALRSGALCGASRESRPSWESELNPTWKSRADLRF